ncbi:TatD family hydrolase [Alteromonadaceae bacterium BrNp21-10]|nr:TatD family hydrolase [Alteromonadaceae bacterium BrNp21-10]
MIDSHCHLDFAAFDPDRSAILQQCHTLGISDILVPGVQRATWSKVQTLAKQSLSSLSPPQPQIHISLGLHPYFLDNYNDDDLEVLAQCYAEDPQRYVALGEIGIDGAINIPLALQTEVFEQQLLLAQKFNKPVIIHHRKSQSVILQSLKRCQFDQGGVLHAFSGNLQQAQQFIDRGFKLGIGGTITYPRAQTTRLTVSQLPLSSLLLETDAPDMPLQGFQGQRNCPTRLPLVLQQLAQLRNESIEEVAHVTSQNFRELFRL